MMKTFLKLAKTTIATTNLIKIKGKNHQNNKHYLHKGTKSSKQQTLLTLKEQSYQNIKYT